MHIAFLRNGVEMLGGTPVSPCKYDYGPIESLPQLLNVTDVSYTLYLCPRTADSDSSSNSFPASAPGCKRTRSFCLPRRWSFH